MLGRLFAHDPADASTMLDLPHPLGPTTPVIGSSKVRMVRSMNDLKPQISRRLILILAPPYDVTIRDHMGHFMTVTRYHSLPANVKAFEPQTPLFSPSWRDAKKLTTLHAVVC